MVNAAMDIIYGNEFYKEGAKLPEHLVKEFEETNPQLLDNYIEINSRWFKIDDPRIKGFVEKNKETNYRLKKYFKIKDKPLLKEDKSNILKARPKKYTKEELKEKSFSELREIGYKLGTKGRAKKELIKEILELQK
jgi:hypothetical protein